MRKDNKLVLDKTNRLFFSLDKLFLFRRDFIDMSILLDLKMNFEKCTKPVYFAEQVETNGFI